MKSDSTITEESLCRWLIDAVARYVRIRASLLQPNTSFQEVGLSSIAAVSLSAEMSDEFGIEVDPMVTWEHPTIGEVARVIFERALVP